MGRDVERAESEEDLEKKRKEEEEELKAAKKRQVNKRGTLEISVQAKEPWKLTHKQRNHRSKKRNSQKLELPRRLWTTLASWWLSSSWSYWPLSLSASRYGDQIPNEVLSKTTWKQILTSDPEPERHFEPLHQKVEFSWHTFQLHLFVIHVRFFVRWTVLSCTRATATSHVKGKAWHF